jgi:hypothetical protein
MVCARQDFTIHLQVIGYDHLASIPTISMTWSSWTLRQRSTSRSPRIPPRPKPQNARERGKPSRTTLWLISLGQTTSRSSKRCSRYAKHAISMACRTRRLTMRQALNTVYTFLAARKHVAPTFDNMRKSIEGLLNRSERLYRGIRHLV